jgi:UPF0271 protein
LVPRSEPGAMIHDSVVATDRLFDFFDTGMMPTVGGASVRLAADSVCIHGDSPDAVAMARYVRDGFRRSGMAIAAFHRP